MILACELYVDHIPVFLKMVHIYGVEEFPTAPEFLCTQVKKLRTGTGPVSYEIGEHC